MAYVSNSSISCGVRELYGIRYSRLPEILRSVTSESHYAFMVFSDYRGCAESRGQMTGATLAKAIVKHKLGKLTESTWKVNPNSGNQIKVWTWLPDRVAIQMHLNK